MIKILRIKSLIIIFYEKLHLKFLGCLFAHRQEFPTTLVYEQNCPWFTKTHALCCGSDRAHSWQHPLQFCGGPCTPCLGKGSVLCSNSWVRLVRGSFSFLCNNSQSAFVSRAMDATVLFLFSPPLSLLCVPVVLHKTLSLSLFPPWGIRDLERVGPAQSFGSEVQEAKPHTGRHWRSNSTFCRSAFLLLWHIFIFNSVEIFLSSFFPWKPLLRNVEYSFTLCEDV